MHGVLTMTYDLSFFSFFAPLPTPVSFEGLAGDSPGTQGMKVSVKKLEPLVYAMMKTAWSQVN